MYRPPIKSPYIVKKTPAKAPDLMSNMNEIVRLVNDLNTLKENLKKITDEKTNELQNVIRETLATLEAVKKTQKGEKGDKGNDGKQGPQGPKGDKGDSGITGKDGKSVSIDEIVPLVLAKIPKPKDGYTPKKGKDYFDGLPAKDVTVDPLAIIDQIMNLPKGKRLTTKHIEGLDQTIQAFQHQLGRGYLHGGGTTIKAGTNIILTTNNDGTTTVSSAGIAFQGSQELSTTTPDGSKQTFAFAHTPLMIFWGGGLQQLGIDYTVLGLNITFTGTLTPQVGDKIINVYQ